MCIGPVSGVADIVPMIVQKLPAHSTVSAFLHCFFVSIVIVNMDLPYVPWWIGEGVTGLALTIPMLIQAEHADRQPLSVIAANAVVQGTPVGIAGHPLR